MDGIVSPPPPLTNNVYISALLSFNRIMKNIFIYQKQVTLTDLIFLLLFSFGEVNPTGY